MQKLKKAFLIGTNNGIVLISEERPDINNILQAADVKQGTYASELIERIYAYFIDTSIDIRTEYIKFYREEYQDIPSFLYRKYGINEKYLSKLSDMLQSHKCLLLIKSLRWGRDYQIDTLFKDREKGNDIIMKTLNAVFVGENDEN